MSNHWAALPASVPRSCLPLAHWPRGGSRKAGCMPGEGQLSLSYAPLLRTCWGERTRGRTRVPGSPAPCEVAGNRPVCLCPVCPPHHLEEHVSLTLGPQAVPTGSKRASGARSVNCHRMNGFESALRAPCLQGQRPQEAAQEAGEPRTWELHRQEHPLPCLSPGQTDGLCWGWWRRGCRSPGWAPVGMAWTESPGFSQEVTSLRVWPPISAHHPAFHRPSPTGFCRARDAAPSWTETLDNFKPRTLQTGQNQVSRRTGSGIQVSMCQGYRGLGSSPNSAPSSWMTVKHFHLSGPQWHHL